LTRFFFAWRQPSGIKTEQITSNISNREMLCSFGLPIFYKGKAKRRRNAGALQGFLTQNL